MSGHLDEAWRLVQAAFRTHDVELAEDSARAISEQVAGELITRGLVVSWDTHAQAVQAHTDVAVRELRAEVEVLRRRTDEPLVTVPFNGFSCGSSAPAPVWGQTG